MAKILAETGTDFEYERILRCGDKLYFPDFTTHNMLIECTYWHDVEQRARELRVKIEDYSKLGFKTIFIVTTSEYKEMYSRLLDRSNATVITPEILRSISGGKSLGG